MVFNYFVPILKGLKMSEDDVLMHVEMIPSSSFIVSDTNTTGKTQLVDFDEYTEIWQDFIASPNKPSFIGSLNRAIDTDPTMIPFVKGVFGKGYDAFMKRLDDNVIRASDARYFLSRYFSTCQRGAGSNLAGFPLIDFDGEGIEAHFDTSYDRNLEVVRNGYNNSIRMSPWRLKIGAPYDNRLRKITRDVAHDVDGLSRSLSSALSDLGADQITVEEATQICIESFDDFTDKPYVDTKYIGRGVLQMDFFLMYPPEIRQLILDGDVSTEELAKLTKEGELIPYIFDVSGGAGSIGILSDLAREHGSDSDMLDHYARYLVESYRAKKGRYPNNVVIVPREADMTLMGFEYVPLQEKLAEMGFDTSIATMESLEESLDGGGSLRCVDGHYVKPELVARRFTYLNDGKDGSRGIIRLDIPENMHIEPTQESRIVASDKRVNSRIIERVCEDSIPYIGASVDDTDLIDDFFGREDLRSSFPEIERMGLILKTFDKVAASGSGREVVSVHPYASGGYVGDVSRNVVESLRRKGVYNLVAHPNLLPLFVSNEGYIPPKTEIKMFAIARY